MSPVPFPEHAWLDGNLVILASDAIAYGDALVAEERARTVAWLRDNADVSFAGDTSEYALNLADAIERGEHRDTSRSLR